MLAAPSQRDVVETLRQRLYRWEVASRPAGASFTSGCHVLDRVLPSRVFQRGRLIEFLADGGCGAAVLAMIVAREACREGGSFVVIDRSRSFYPPAAANLGLDLNMIVVRPRTRQDQLWALNQSLRCQGVGAVLCWPEKLDDRAFRTLQLAAETSGGMGLLVRPRIVRGEPTWSELQLLVDALPTDSTLPPDCTFPINKTTRRLRIEVAHCRHGNAGTSVEVELDDETGTLQESPALPVAPALAVAALAS